MIEVEGLRKVFPNGHEALKEISFRIEPGECVAIVGRSGAGKSTLLRCLYLIPTYNLINNGIDPESDLETIFAGGHDASLLAINEGQVDAGAASEPQYNTMIEEGLIDAANFVELLKSDPIPESPGRTVVISIPPWSSASAGRSSASTRPSIPRSSPRSSTTTARATSSSRTPCTTRCARSSPSWT